LYKRNIFVVSVTFLIYLSFFEDGVFASKNNTSPNLNSILLTKELEDIGVINTNFYYPLVLDEEGNVYVNSTRGYVKYSKEGDYIHEAELQTNYRDLSNLVYSEGKIYIISKYTPGYFFVFNSVTGEMEQSIQIVPNNEVPVTQIYKFDLSNISVSFDTKYVYFGSSSPNKIYRYNISSHEIEFLSVPKVNINTVGKRLSAPINVGDNKIMFSTQYGYLELYSYDNMASSIYNTTIKSDYAYTRQFVRNGIKYVVGSDYFYTIHHDHVCVFDLSEGVNKLCKKIEESSINSNLVVDKYDNVYFLVTKVDLDNTKHTIIKKYDSSLELLQTLEISYIGNRDSYIYLAENNNLFISSTNLYEVDTTENVLKYVLEYPKVEDTRVLFTTNFIYSNDSFYLYRQYANTKNVTKRHFIYRFDVLNGEPIDPCPLKFYCDSTPKYNPVILIHGLGGNYEQWFDTKRKIVRERILEEFKKEDPEFPDDWVYAYSYGYKFGDTYNYQGKIEDITNNLHFDVDRLSNEHKMAGGDGKVTLIGYSLGGLVARHYILEKTGFPGEQNLNADTKIGKFIAVASPVNGSSILGIADRSFDNDQSANKYYKKAINYILDLSGSKVDITKDVGNQLSQESDYIKSLSYSKLPLEVKYYRNYSDITLGFSYNIFDTTLKKETSIGDGVVIPVDTQLDVAYVGEDVFRDTIYVDLQVTTADASLDFDTGFLVPYIVHMEVMSYSGNIDTLLNYLKQ